MYRTAIFVSAYLPLKRTFRVLSCVQVGQLAGRLVAFYTLETDNSIVAH